MSQSQGDEERRERLLTRAKNLVIVLVLLMIVAAVLVTAISLADSYVRVPWPLTLIIATAAGVAATLAAWQKPAMVRNKAWHLTVIVSLAGITAIAMWLGFQDVVWAVSFPAQILGTFFILSGIITFSGLFLVTARALPFAPPWVAGSIQSGCIAGAALAGLYVALTVVAHSFRYEPDKAWAFAILAVICLALAIQLLPAAWKSISGFVKAVGISLALLGSAANFWFQSIYLPENTQEGIQYTASVDSVAKSGNGWIATLDFSMENQSSVTAVTLGTMVVVRELIFSPDNAGVSADTAEQKATSYAKDLFTEPPGAYWAAGLNPNIGTTGSNQPAILTIIQPIGDDSNLHPNDTVSREFDVEIPPIPAGKVAALDVQWHVAYARSTRLALGHRYSSALRTSSSYCRNYVQTAWVINQSALVRFTRGAQVFNSLWCTDLQYPAVYWDIQAPREPFESRKVQAEIEAAAGISHSDREDILPLRGT